MATVIAWGAKFSEHPLCIADRHQNQGQSAFAKVLIHRARDLAEDMKVHRIPNADHVVIALLLEPLQSRKCGRYNPLRCCAKPVPARVESLEDNAGAPFRLLLTVRMLLNLPQGSMASGSGPRSAFCSISRWAQRRPRAPCYHADMSGALR